MVASKFLNPRNDIAFRRIFGTEKNKDILIHFINDILNLKGDDTIKNVTFLSPIQEPEIASKKQSVIDVLCTNEIDEQIIVEMQVAPQQGFEKRALYYASKAYFRQLNKGQEKDGQYANLKRVIFIAITDYVIFKNKPSYKSDHLILDKDTHENDLKDFCFAFLELPKFNVDDINKLNNILEKWCYYFKYAEETSEDDLKKIIGSDLVIKRAYDEINKFNWTEEELMIYEQEIKRVMDNKAAEDYIFEQGIEQGIEKGREEGIEQGREEGIEQGREEGKKNRDTEVIINMLKENFDINTIAKITGISETKILEIKNTSFN